MKTKGCALTAAVLLALLVMAIALAGPGLLRKGEALYGPVTKLSSSSKRLERLARERPWKDPATLAVSPEQLVRFLAVRRQLADLYRQGKGLPTRHQHKQGFEEMRQALTDVGEVMGAQVEILARSGMPPAEYGYLERVIYRRWRAPLRAAGTYPAALQAAAGEIEAAAAVEAAPAVARRLRAVAAELRARRPPAPPGVPEETHALLVDHLEEIDLYSLDGIETIPLSR